jgi:hypothetical protein
VFNASARAQTLAVVALAAALALAGCGGAESKRSSPRTLNPGQTLARFLAVSARGDARATWALLSRATQARYGTFADFRGDEAPVLARLARRLRRLPLIVATPITSRWAVAAVAGGRSAFAAALSHERGRWRLELGGPIRIEAVRPNPGERVVDRTQIAADVRAPAAIAEAGVWVDNRALPSRGGGLSPRAVGMFAEADDLASGSHAAVAFSSTARDASALAWAFSARRSKRGAGEPEPAGPFSA